MISALKAYFPEEVRWTYPEGGFFVWVTLPQWMDAKAMLPRVISEIKVAYVSGAAFFTDGTGKNTIRLAYSQATDEDIVEGVKRLGGFLRREIARGLKETVELPAEPDGCCCPGKQELTIVERSNDHGSRLELSWAGSTALQ